MTFKHRGQWETADTASSGHVRNCKLPGLGQILKPELGGFAKPINLNI